MWWKALVILVLSVAIFGSAAYFGYDILIKPRQAEREEAKLPPPTAPPDPALRYVEHARKLKQEGKLLEARNELQSLLESYPKSSAIGEIKKLLGEINAHFFFSPIPGPGKEEYIVKAGDALAKIERRFKTTGELIMRINDLADPTKLSIGQRLMIVHPEASLTIDQAAKTVTVMDHGRFFKEYRAKTWNVPASKAKGPISARVTEKIAWKEGARVAFGQKEFRDSLRWVVLSVPGYTIYADTEGDKDKTSKPPNGIGVVPSDADEIATMVRGGTPVTIQ